jgi:ABC-2 type transport system ATP-binding protein
LGGKQLAKLAQAIVHGPRLLLLDEPTNGLDPPGRQRMLKLIREIRDTPGMHLLVSSHLLRDVEECCDEVLILKDGLLSARCNLAEERRAQRKFLELETTGGTGFPEAAARLGCEYASFGGGRLKLVLPERLTIQQLYAAAAEQGVQIRRFSYRRDSLEDIFLRAMEAPEGRTEAAPGESGGHGGP